MPLIYYFVNNRRYSQTFTMATSPQQPFFWGGHSIRNLSTMAMATSLQWPFFGGRTLHTEPLYNGHGHLSTMAIFWGADTPYGTSIIQWPWPPLYNGHFLGADTPYGTSLQWPLSSVICLQLLKERNNRRFGSYSCRNRLLTISHITFRDCCLHIFSVNLSQNSCIKG